MQYVRCDISTLCIGQAASGAAVLLAAGAHGKRFATPHSRILLHQPSGGTQGQAIDIDIHAKEILRTREMLDGILARHTGQTVERIHDDTDRDFIMVPDQALEYGIIDRVHQRRVDGSE
jgi:ATP-dependent Clp protease protease subunit